MTNSEQARSGHPYLNDLRWAHVSREERFFCAHLYALAYQAPHRLVEAINGANRSKEPLAISGDWELGFEVCLFRDLRHHGLLRCGAENPSLKRTFDLCLFSGSRLVVIEAKAQQGFEQDRTQFKGFLKDLQLARAALPGIEIELLLLASERALEKLAAWKGTAIGDLPDHKSLSWNGLAALYQDPVLQRAEALYGDVGGRSGNRRMSGSDLLRACAQANAPRYVGRQGGFEAFKKNDLPFAWRTRSYEVSSELPDNGNWFGADIFEGAAKPFADSAE